MIWWRVELLCWLQITKCQHGISINKRKYVKELPKEYGLESLKHAKTAIASNFNPELHQVVRLSLKVYRGMIGLLLYLTTSMPNVMFNVCVCARFQYTPKELRLNIVKKIFKYLVGTKNLCRDGDLEFIGYFDADYVGCKADRKSTFGSYQFLGQSLVLWHFKKQTSMALSAAKAKYIVVRLCLLKRYGSTNHWETLDWTRRRILSSVTIRVLWRSLMI